MPADHTRQPFGRVVHSLAGTVLRLTTSGSPRARTTPTRGLRLPGAASSRCNSSSFSAVNGGRIALHWLGPTPIAGPSGAISILASGRSGALAAGAEWIAPGAPG